VLFSPERQANALGAAFAFSIVLLPYSIIGPFVGTVLDRISRQRAILTANLFRAINLVVISLLISNGHTGIELTIFVLTAFGINRLILAGLSAGLPLMINSQSLVTANAMAVTGGSILVVLGGGAGFGLRRFLDHFNNANHADGILIATASAGYFVTAGLMLRIKKKEIGPLDHEKAAASVSQGVLEMKDGLRFLRRHTDAYRGIIATAIQRGGLTSLVLIALLLERNTFHVSVKPEDGLSGLALALSIAGVGIMCGALIAPFGVDRFGRHRWIRSMMLGSALPPLLLVASPHPISLYFVAFFTSLFGQSMKVTNDALVQSKIDDYYRGRVFAVYDVAVNGAIVGGAVLAATILPTSGKSIVVPILISAAYLIAYSTLLKSRKFISAP
jgi:hypothetical protein